jgi:putative SOS response-associated peptidase YedK
MAHSTRQCASEGVLARRRKGSREQIIEWSARLQAAVARPRYDMSLSQTIPAIRGSADGTHELVEMRWGPIPYWSKQPKNPLQHLQRPLTGVPLPRAGRHRHVQPQDLPVPLPCPAW